ncbi:MAG: RsmF rRNA methyltransferase first C-terminal domain-containing protein [Anaerolineae bacterium]
MDNEWPSPWPETFVSRMSAWLGNETEAFLTALRKRDYGLRLNPRRAPISVLQADLPWQARPVPWCPEGLWLDEETVDQGEPLGRHPYHTAGVYYIQDPSAMAAAVLLDPKPGEWVLDLAAAPGSKATHLAARMENEGVLVTNDVSRGRASILAMNLERMGVTNALVTNAYPEQLREAWAGLFDAMLVDAPCSGEGTFSRDPRALQDWSLETVRTYAARQVNILDQAAPLVRRGGQILYGTCTFSPEENEGVIAEFLAAHPDFELMELPMLPTMDRGHPEWIGAPEELRKAGRFWPHRGPGHGHFYALLRRTGAPPEELPARWTENAMPGRVLHRYLDTLGRILVEDPPQEGLILTPDDHCYITPMAPSLWANVPVMRPGWWVASLRHNKIFPDHALAMALHPREVKAHISLDPDDQHLDQYLDGSSWPDEGPAGYLLITVDGYPLGWAKRAGGKLRSRYPVHLRRRRALP